MRLPSLTLFLFCYVFSSLLLLFNKSSSRVDCFSLFPLINLIIKVSRDYTAMTQLSARESENRLQYFCRFFSCARNLHLLRHCDEKGKSKRVVKLHLIVIPSSSSSSSLDEPARHIQIKPHCRPPFPFRRVTKTHY